MNNMYEWRCGEGHVLGMVVVDNGVGRLLLYRRAVKGSEEVEIEVMAVVEGNCEVRCSICGGVRSWFMSARMVRRLMRTKYAVY